MFCIHCGAPNPEDAVFCSRCGKAIGAAAPTAEAGQLIADSAEKLPGDRSAQSSTPAASPAQPVPVQSGQTSAAEKSKPVLWVLGGFAACLLIVIAVAVGTRMNQSSSGTEAARPIASDPPAAAPAAYTAPAAAPAAAAPTADTTPTPAAENTPAPVSAPVQPAPTPAPAAPQNPIVGDWKATTFIGSTIGLHLGADGRYVLNPGSDEGVYVYSTGDGTLRLQSNSFFSKGIMVWSCQLSGDTLSCVDPNGAGHVYNRAR